MNSQQGSDRNNQSSKDSGVGKDRLDQSRQAAPLGDSLQSDRLPGSPQPGGLGGAQQSGSLSDSQQSERIAGARQDAPSGNLQQGKPSQHRSNNPAGGMPPSPGGKRLAADQDMDEDSGLSNRQNRQSAERDEGSRQSQQSNVGRRSDGTPD
jgi:hypothetical protein